MDNYSGSYEEALDVVRAIKERDRIIEELRAENERLRADAKRYRWLRPYYVTALDFDEDWNQTVIIDDKKFEELDAAIDAAREGR